MSDSEAKTAPDPRTRAAAEGKARTLLRVAATTTVVGIFLAAAGDEDLSRWLTIAGIILLIVALHRFGRLGADEPLDLDRVQSD